MNKNFDDFKQLYIYIYESRLLELHRCLVDIAPFTINYITLTTSGASSPPALAPPILYCRP